jgi:hypothetical protein
MSANFSDLQSVDTANGADQMMLRLNNGATGPDGFARIEISDLNSVFTSSLTAADAKVKQMSAQWDESYSLVSANSSVFALTNSNSAFWDTAYFALTTNDYNYGNKVFDNIVINGPADISRLGPVFQIKRDPNTTVDMMQVIPATTNSMVRITTAGQVGINVGNDFVIASDIFLYINGNQRIDGSGGNALTINGDMFVNGSLSALSATYINSIVTNTSALSISSNGRGPALYVNQYDTNSVEDITQFQSNAANIIFKGNGNVTGIRDLSGFGRIIAGSNNIASNAASYILGTNNNDNLNNVIILGSNISAHTANYTYVQNLSTAGTVATIGGTSFDWNLTNVLVKSQSGLFLSLSSTVLSQSANNASVYSTTNANSATWGGVSTAFRVVSAINTSALTAIGLNTDINAALVAKGTGATIAQIPDATYTGGNARGAYATDWQKTRTDPTHVASATGSTIGGGQKNKATLDYATVAGGDTNTASSNYATVAGGYINTASGYGSAIGGGSNNIVTGTYSTVAGGDHNTIQPPVLFLTSNYATIAGGLYNTATADYATVGGGGGLSLIASNAASGQYATVGGGGTNKSLSIGATIAGGRNNSVAGSYATVGGGGGDNGIGVDGNNASGDYSTIGGGRANAATVENSTIGGGQENIVSGINSTVCGGDRNNARGLGATVLGGTVNSADGPYSTSLGQSASATNHGEFAISSGYYTYVGDNKNSTFLSRITTTAPGSAVAYLNGSFTGNEEIIMPPNSTYAYTATIAGLSSHSNVSGLHYILRGFAKCNGSSVVAVYPAVSDLTQRIPVALNAGMSAAGNKLRVVVYTPSATAHYWTARIQGEYIKF